MLKKVLQLGVVACIGYAAMDFGFLLGTGRGIGMAESTHYNSVDDSVLLETTRDMVEKTKNKKLRKIIINESAHYSFEKYTK